MQRRLLRHLQQLQIINESHFNRLNGLLDNAQTQGAKVLPVGSSGERSSGMRKLHPHIVLNTSDEMDISSEEIFGPVLPVIPYDNLEKASDYINQRPRPLALYYFDKDRSRIDTFLGRTISGGAAINDTVIHFAQDDLPFGGIGPSGTGVCHGFEGFRELSHAKSVFHQAQLNGGSMLNPPYGALFDRITGFLIR